MNLAEFKVAAGLAVSDMERAVEFYEGKLGLTGWTRPEDNRAYRCAGGTIATPASWCVVDIEKLVDELSSKGVVFVVRGDPCIATFEGGAEVAYFKAPDGNTLSIVESGRL